MLGLLLLLIFLDLGFVPFFLKLLFLTFVIDIGQLVLQEPLFLIIHDILDPFVTQVTVDLQSLHVSCDLLFMVHRSIAVSSPVNVTEGFPVSSGFFGAL